MSTSSLRRSGAAGPRLLAAGLLVAGVVLVVAGVRALRASAVREAAPDHEPGPMVTSWPPDPILGKPTEDDLKRHRRPARIPKFITALERAAGEPRREPGPGPGPRLPLVRWGAAAIATGLVVFLAMAFEQAVFRKDPATLEQEHTGTGGEGLLPVWGVEDSGCPLPEDQNEGEWGTTAYVCSGQEDFVAGPRVVASPKRVETPAPVPVDPMATGHARAAGCAPLDAAPVVRPVRPAVTRAVGHQWRRIETWLRANAPDTYRTLKRPARAGIIAKAEAQMGVRFPDDLRASLLRHNGAVNRAGAFGYLGATAMGVREIRDNWRVNCRVVAAQGGAMSPREGWWHGRLVPFGDYGNGDLMVTDSSGGEVGEANHETGLRFDGAVPSYHAMLKRTADALLRGRPVEGMYPVVKNGRLEWDTRRG
ncbi:SMI1/KNR4 family protein [Spongiactinospora gelatinilytica]|uniref:SMI1/KNR4 family protein n=1 Tax=Spongiactinospora gelatinilytica TaxID=2666298 RepID=UPI0011B94BD0|nr:SMI1/KNR4 family protein [Spongiactinospora gelatinilytica]